MIKIRFLLATILVLFAATTALPAAAISGGFDLSGVITVTGTHISWTSNGSPAVPNKATIDPPVSGSFTGLAGTTVTIQDLDRSIEPVGVQFPAHLFISFDAAPALPTLNINFISAGDFTNTACTQPPAGGQTCTLSAAQAGGTSPFDFVNKADQNTGAITSSATFSFSGITSDGMSSWRGTFTSQFDTPFQTVINSFLSGGTVTHSYSSTFSVFVTPIPEPGTFAMFGLGLLTVSGVLRLRRRARMVK